MNWQEGLFPHQVSGVEFVTQPRTNPNIAIFDEPGVGKTKTAIRSADKLNLRRLLVISPAVARINWQRELQANQIIQRSIHVVKSTKATIPIDADVVILGVDMAANTNIKNQILNLHFDMMIFDEAHAAKNRTALRTKSIYGERLNGAGGLIQSCDRTLILTGTPTPNAANEIYTHIRALAPERLMTPEGRLTYTQFVNRFCVVDTMHFGGRTVERIRGNKNTAELKERLKGFYLRRRKEDVLKDLPPLLWGTIVLEPPKDAIKELGAFEKDKQVDEIKAVLAAAAASHYQKDDTLADNILAQANRSALATLRRLVGLAKVKPTTEFIENEFENGAGKIILFCYHKEVITQMTAALAKYKPVVITGDTSKSARQKAIDSFQQDPEVKIFIGQITATNSAITLTASDNVLIMEPDWTPSTNSQAAARAHRIGARGSCVLARFVTLSGSIDEDITRVILRKTKQIAEVML